MIRSSLLLMLVVCSQLMAQNPYIFEVDMNIYEEVYKDRMKERDYLRAEIYSIKSQRDSLEANDLYREKRKRFRPNPTRHLIQKHRERGIIYKSYTELGLILDSLRLELIRVNFSIMQVQGEIFEYYSKDSVTDWLDGYAEVVVPESEKEKNTARREAYIMAYQDASYRTGIVRIFSHSIVINNELYKDHIEMNNYLKVVETDETGDYGKIRIINKNGVDIYSLRVRARFRIDHVSNPFYSRIKKLTGGAY